MPRKLSSNYISALRFNWLTPYYDIVVSLTTRERSFKQALITQAGIEAGYQVLDLASGTGTLAIWTKQRYPFANVTGIDGDEAILAIAKNKIEKAKVVVHFDQGMSYCLPYQGSSFDRVVSSLFFHHLTWDAKQRTAQEVFRILKPGAELHVADWGRPANALMRGLFLFIQILDGFKNTEDNISGRIIDIFEFAGFDTVSEQKSFNTIFGTIRLYRAVKKKEFE